MTEADTSSSSQTFAIVQRRLVGLAVLLSVVFLISLLLRGGSGRSEALPSVVIPLGGSNASVNPVESASSAPTLDVPEPSTPPAASSAAPQESAPAASAMTVTPPVATASKPSSKPEPKPTTKPRAEKPTPADLPKPAKAAKPSALAEATAKSQPSKTWVVVGSYKDPMAAQAIVNRIQRAGLKAGAVPVMVAGERLNRVRAGPFASKEDAESARVTLIVEGLTKSAIVTEK